MAGERGRSVAREWRLGGSASVVVVEEWRRGGSVLAAAAAAAARAWARPLNDHGTASHPAHASITTTGTSPSRLSPDRAADDRRGLGPDASAGESVDGRRGRRRVVGERRRRDQPVSGRRGRASPRVSSVAIPHPLRLLRPRLRLV
ncbi:hypothetical protein GCM10009733_069780 [Nonomuraea maheshkhaliensis]|uniref:Uncharacterized protein n=1 Tax=Nonomuraea maheshkhaliensis TaxID=419590 RepID=A0ABP4RY19_9ACTN